MMSSEGQRLMESIMKSNIKLKDETIITCNTDGYIYWSVEEIDKSIFTDENIKLIEIETEEDVKTLENVGKVEIFKNELGLYFIEFRDLTENEKDFKKLKTENKALGQQLIQVKIDNMKKNQTIAMLGKQQVQHKLEIMKLKGGN